MKVVFTSLVLVTKHKIDYSRCTSVERKFSFVAIGLKVG